MSLGFAGERNKNSLRGAVRVCVSDKMSSACQHVASVLSKSVQCHHLVAAECNGTFKVVGRVSITVSMINSNN